MTKSDRIIFEDVSKFYGKILGVMVHSVKDESDLRIALQTAGLASAY